ncbi:MAG: DUF559 domain-containing protein [Litorimonas sp.]
MKLSTHRKVSPAGLSRAGCLRKSMSEEEVMLWVRLREFRRNGWAFRRQAQMGSYIADFLCRNAMLVVEVDGSQHDLTGQIEHDARRDKWMENEGYTVLRFSTSDVRSRIDWVLDNIEVALQAAS